MNQTVTCIITHYGIGSALANTLKSLELVHFPHKVIVVNNDQRPGILDDVAKQFPQIQILQNTKNGGFASGMNLGIRKALEGGSDFVWLLGQDFTFEPDCLDQLMKLWPRLETPGFLGALTDLNATAQIYFAKAIVYPSGRSRHIFEDSFIGKVPELEKDYGPSDYVNGSSLFTHRSVLEKVGPLPEEYFLYFEDTEWGLRAQKSGFKNYVSYKCRLHHHRPPLEHNETAEYYCLRNEYLFKTRNGFAKPGLKLLTAMKLAKKITKAYLKSQKTSVYKSALRDLWHERWGERTSY